MVQKLASLITMGICFHFNFCASNSLLASLTYSSKAHAIHANKVIEIKIVLLLFHYLLSIPCLPHIASLKMLFNKNL